MKRTVKLILLCFCCRLVKSIPLLENGTNLKIHNFSNFNVNNARPTNPIRNPFHTFENRIYPPKINNYQNSPRNIIDNYHNKWPRHLPLSPFHPRNYQPQNIVPPRYNILNSYNTAPRIRPMKPLHNQYVKQKHILDEVKPLYPTRNIKSEEKPTQRLIKSPDLKNIISNPEIQNHYTSSQKKYMIIYPNGTVEDVNNLEPVIVRHPNYILVNGADIIPINNKIPDQSYNHEIHASSDLKSTPKPQVNQAVTQNKTPKAPIQINYEETIKDTSQNGYDTPYVFPSTVIDNNATIKSTPTTIIEINPEFVTLVNDSITETQSKAEANARSPVHVSEDFVSADASEKPSNEQDSLNLSINSSQESVSASDESETKISFNSFVEFEDDVITNLFGLINKDTTNALDENSSNNIVSNSTIENIAGLVGDLRNLFISTQINETDPNENITKEDFVEKIQSVDLVQTIEDDISDILNRSTILNINTDIAISYSEQKHPFDEIHLPIETDTESNIYDTSNIFNDTSEQFRENRDPYINKDGNRFSVNPPEINDEHVLHILPSVSSAEIVKNYDLPTNQQIDESKSNTFVPWTDTLNETKVFYEVNASEIDVSATSTIRGDTTTTDDINQTTTDPPPVYFKIDRYFWQKLINNEIPFDIIYFFQVQEPVIQRGIKTITYPNGTAVTYETARDLNEDNQPILIKNID